MLDGLAQQGTSLDRGTKKFCDAFLLEQFRDGMLKNYCQTLVLLVNVLEVLFFMKADSAFDIIRGDFSVEIDR